MPLDKPDVEWFKNKYKDERFTFEIEEREEYTMNNYDGIFKPLRNSYWSTKLGYDVMTSDSWRTGGTVCSYDGWESEVEPAPGVVPGSDPAGIVSMMKTLAVIVPPVNVCPAGRISISVSDPSLNV